MVVKNLIITSVFSIYCVFLAQGFHFKEGNFIGLIMGILCTSLNIVDIIEKQKKNDAENKNEKKEVVE